MNTRRIFKLSFFVFVYLLIFVNLSNAVSTSTTVPSGIWNSTSTWQEGRTPNPADEVTIGKGFTVYLDTFAPCNALSITLEKYAKIESLGVVRSTLTVSGNINFGEGAKIEIISNNSNDYFALTAQDLLLSNPGAKLTLTANASNSRFNLNVCNINISDELKIEVNSLNTQINLTATGAGDSGKVSLAANANFSVRITSGPSVVNLTIDDVSIPADGTTELINNVYSSTITLSLAASLINNGILKIWATDPGGISKPDSPTVRRNCQVVGTTAYSYIRAGSGSSTSLLHSELSGLGRAVSDEYGICVTDLDGTSATGKFEIFNCNIHNGYAGIYLKNSTRLNKWYNQGISSSVIHNNAFAGIWFENTTKSEIYKCIISTNSTTGLNIGYGIYFLGSPMNSIIGSTIYGNKIKGIYLKNSDKNLLKDNLVHSQNSISGEEGIYLYASQKNVIFSNQCYNNPVHGIALEYGSNYNYLAKNYCYNNNNGGLRVRYGSDNNVFVTNTSSTNSRTGFSSHSSIKNLALEEAYRNNTLGDILIEGEANKGYKSQLWLKNCLLQSSTEFADTPEKEEFTHPESWVISQKHNGDLGLTRIWGNFTTPQTWLTSELKWSYSTPIYEETILSWIGGQIPDLRYDDSGGRAISSITTSSTTKTELWLVSYDAEQNRWLVQGSVSGVQKNWLEHDTDYISDNGEVRFRLTHQAGGPTRSEEYVFITVAGSKDENVQKKVEFSDFSDPKYIGASFTNQSGGSFEAVGTSVNPTLFTNKVLPPKTSFYYGITLGGTINKLEYTDFTFLNPNGLTFNSAPLNNTKNIKIMNLQPGTTYASYLTANNVTHTFENIVIDTINVTGTYNITATNSLLYFQEYTKPSLPDKLMNSSLYWGSTLVAGVNISVSTFTVSPSGQLSVGTTVTILVTLKDSFSNPVSSKTVIIDVSPLRSNDILTQPVGLTNNLGQSSGTFCGNTAESKLITVRGDNLVLITSYTLTFITTTQPQLPSEDPEKVFKESVYVYPNPVKNGQAKFNYSLGSNAKVTLKVYSILGELIFEEEKSETTGTNKTLPWNCINESNNTVGTGIYIYKMIADDGTKKYEVIKKMVIIQ